MEFFGVWKIELKDCFGDSKLVVPCEDHNKLECGSIILSLKSKGAMYAKCPQRESLKLNRAESSIKQGVVEKQDDCTVERVCRLK